jgi:hypothetical protein
MLVKLASKSATLAGKHLINLFGYFLVFRELYCLEHGIQPDGRMPSEGTQQSRFILQIQL